MYETIFKNGTLLCDPMSPIDLFKVKQGEISIREDGRYSITMDLAPFCWSGEEVNTEIRLDYINFNKLEFSQLSGKTFSFPINPTEGYIDGSVYLEGHHNDIDVLLISFGVRYNELAECLNSNEDYITATILYKFCWEGGEKEHYPETKRINVVLHYRHINYDEIEQIKHDRWKRKLAQKIGDKKE